MIAVISRNNDSSTNFVLQWLIRWKKKFIRFNIEDSPLSLNIRINNTNCSIDLIKEGQVIDINEITSSWYRRGNFSLIKASPVPVDAKKGLSFPEELERVFQDENKIIRDYVHTKLEEKPSIGSYQTASINKLYALEKARQAGLLIPDTIVSSNKDEVIRFLNQHQKIISKAAYEAPHFRKDDLLVSYYTKIFEKEAVDNLPLSFAPSLFQRYIPKKYEIRVFYLDGHCYSMAIFSQENKKTTTDFRQYDYVNPNRVTPFTLPVKISKSIEQFMKSTGLNCGSLDLIVSDEKEFYFLEVNPIGQFGMTSSPCNYYLHKKIAQKLIHE